jgi:GAF domain-containing protein
MFFVGIMSRVLWQNLREPQRHVTSARAGFALTKKRRSSWSDRSALTPGFGEAGITVPEVLLVPIFVGEEPFGTLWIVAHDGQQFNSGNARVMTELAGFAGLALQVPRTEWALNQN